MRHQRRDAAGALRRGDARGARPPGAALGIHTHNDAECAVANSLAAVDAGRPDGGPGTINGYGERCGNANLVSIIPSLSLKMGFRTVPPERLAELTALSVFVAETANLQPDAWAPYVGHNAFAHKGGMHQQGVNADARAYEHIDPATVGNERRVLVSELSGRGTILAKARELGVDLSDDASACRAILARLKELEHEGYHFEVADGSFELLLERETGVYEPLFTPRASASSPRSAPTARGDRGDGQALPPRRAPRGHRGGQRPGQRSTRRCGSPRAACAELISLVNFKVRILDETKGTGAVTRVLIDSATAATRGARSA